MPPDDAWVVVDDDAGAGSVGMREEHPLSYASIARLSKGEDAPAVDMSASVASLPPPRDATQEKAEEEEEKEEEEAEEAEEAVAVAEEAAVHVSVEEDEEEAGNGDGGEDAAVEWVVETQPRKRRGKRRGKRKAKKSATPVDAAAASNPFTLIAALEDSVVGAHTEEQRAPQRAPSPVAVGDVSAARKRRAKHSRATARATKGAPGRAAASPSPPPALAHVALLLATHALTFFVGVYVGRREERALCL